MDEFIKEKIVEEKTINKRKRIYKKKKGWKAEEESLLITIWGDFIDDLRGSRKNKHIYHEIANALMVNGFEFNSEEVRVKIHNLTNKYREEKRKIGPSGGSPSNWEFFERVHQILGSFKSNSIELMMDESTDVPTTSTSCTKGTELLSDEVSLDDSFMTPPQKKAKKNVQAFIMEKIEESNNILKEEAAKSAEVNQQMLQLQKELVEIERDRNEILKAFLSK